MVRHVKYYNNNTSIIYEWKAQWSEGIKDEDTAVCSDAIFHSIACFQPFFVPVCTSNELFGPFHEQLALIDAKSL